MSNKTYMVGKDMPISLIKGRIPIGCFLKIGIPSFT